MTMTTTVKVVFTTTTTTDIRTIPTRSGDQCTLGHLNSKLLILRQVYAILLMLLAYDINQVYHMLTKDLASA